MLFPSPVNAGDAEGVWRVGSLTKSRGLHEAEHLLRLREARHAGGKIGIGAAGAGDQRPHGGQDAAEVKAVELAQQTARLAEVQDCNFAAGRQYAVDLAKPSLVVCQVAKPARR